MELAPLRYPGPEPKRRWRPSRQTEHEDMAIHQSRCSPETRRHAVSGGSMHIVPRGESYRDGKHDQELRARRGRTGSHVRFERHSIFYVASVFFLLSSMSALGIIDRSIYGEWFGKPGNKITQTLNLLAIFTSLFLFWWGTRKIRSARFNRILPLAAPSLLLISVLWSVAPGVTFTQGTAYLFVVIGAIGI